MSFSRKLPFARRGLSALLAAMLLPSIANAFSPFVVRDIQVNGIQRVDAGTVFSYLPVRVGEQFTETQASEAIQRLYATGFFSDVRIDTENNVLVVTVQERPTIASVSFNGMREFDAKGITQSLRQVGFGEGRVFDRSMLERARFEIEQQYLSKGKYGVEINPIITPLPRNRVGVSFEIFEGDRAKIKEIHVIGNKAFSEGTLKDEMELTTSGMMTWYTGTDKYSREKPDALLLSRPGLS
jgi:outer membrane protein insertion porin family